MSAGGAFEFRPPFQLRGGAGNAVGPYRTIEFIFVSAAPPGLIHIVFDPRSCNGGLFSVAPSAHYYPIHRGPTVVG
jgi:hypothetical protein